jgi:hypothetical protein
MFGQRARLRALIPLTNIQASWVIRKRWATVVVALIVYSVCGSSRAGKDLGGGSNSAQISRPGVAVEAMMGGRGLISWAHGHEATDIDEAPQQTSGFRDRQSIRARQSSQSLRGRERRRQQRWWAGAARAYGSLGLGVPRADRGEPGEAGRRDQTGGHSHQNHRTAASERSSLGTLTGGGWLRYAHCTTRPISFPNTNLLPRVAITAVGRQALQLQRSLDQWRSSYKESARLPRRNGTRRLASDGGSHYPRVLLGTSYAKNPWKHLAEELAFRRWLTPLVLHAY